MARLVLPRVQAMVLCDEVDRSAEEHGVYHLTGVRHAISAPSFPAVRSMRVFLHMSGHQGETQCHIRVYHRPTEAVLFQTKTKIVTFQEPTLVVPVVFHLRGCVFPAKGVYIVEILADNKTVGERRLMLRDEE
jgi:hypothetical protein